MSAPQLTQYALGGAAVTADGLNTFQQTCDTYQQLRGLVGIQGMQVFARGQTYANDGLGAAFYWNSTSMLADNNTTVLKPTGGGPVGRWILVNTAAQSAVSTQKIFTVTGAVAGVDAYTQAAAAVAQCKANGGGIVLFPYIGGYTISAPIVVDFNNCTIWLDDNCTFTMTDPTKLVGPNAPYQTGVNGAAIVGFYFGGLIAAGSPVGNRYYVQNCALIGLRQSTVNTNAQNVTGFTYVVGSSGQHAPVVNFGSDNFVCENIIFKNGLVGGLYSLYGGNTYINNCIANTTLYDNGITIGYNREQIAAFSNTDPTTWSNGKIVNCTGISCANHAIDSYGAVGVTMTNPVSIGCGNNSNADPSGPAGGIGVEIDGSYPTRDYRVTVINPRVDNSYGFGLRTNCLGTRVIGGRITGTKNPSAYTDSTPKIWGSGVFVQGAATLELIGTDVENSDQFGIRMAGSGSNFPSLFIRGGRFTGNGANPAGSGPYALSAALYAVDFNELVISPDTLWENNGNTVDTTAGNQYTINLNNSVTNTDGGKAVIAGRFDSNNGGVWTASRVGTIDTTKGISGSANGVSWASAYFAMYVSDKVTNLQLGHINLLQNGNAKTARIFNAIGAVNVAVDFNTIIGDQTNLGLPKVQIGTISGTNYSNPVQANIFISYIATYTPNSSYGNVIIGSPYLTGNMTIANDSPSFIPAIGQTITFTLQQDATGGRTVSWGTNWKGATLTGAGTANQIAQVTFRYTGSVWQQVSSTGWLS